MFTKNIIVAGDGHFHLYPCFDPARAFLELIRSLDSLVESAHIPSENLSLSFPRRRESSPNPSSGFPINPSNDGLSGMTNNNQKQEIFRLAFLAESEKFDYFHQIIEKQFGEFQITAGPEVNCLNIVKGGEKQLCLIAGRQVVTKEKLEVLGLGMEEKISEGLPAEEIIGKILAAGGLPVLAFSPGKWLFKRGQIALKLIEHYGKSLLIGDSALRPIGWREPGIMRLPNGKILPGSDPLPMPGEEKYAGCYGFVYQGLFDVSRPLTAIKEIITNHPEAILPAGRRRSLTNVMISLYRLQKTK